jgi:hypothetical protein
VEQLLASRFAPEVAATPSTAGGAGGVASVTHEEHPSMLVVVSLVEETCRYCALV